jgi:hypothetical protein
MRLNHSRYLDYYAKDVADREHEKAKQTPTHKQIAFFNKLYAMCKANQVDTDMGYYAKTRMDYARAIDELLSRLRENGIDVKGNNKQADYVIKVGEDRRGRAYAKERIDVRETV